MVTAVTSPPHRRCGCGCGCRRGHFGGEVAVLLFLEGIESTRGLECVPIDVADRVWEESGVKAFADGVGDERI